MKSIKDFLFESLNEAYVTESEIKSEKDFREYAENKFKEEFGDELDKEKMNNAIDNLIKDYKEGDDWSELVETLNKIFTPNPNKEQ